MSPEGFSTQGKVSPPTGLSQKVRDFNRFGIDPAASRSSQISKFVVPDRKQSWSESGAMAVRELAPRTSVLACALSRLRGPAYARIQLGVGKYYRISMPSNLSLHFFYVHLCCSIIGFLTLCPMTRAGNICALNVGWGLARHPYLSTYLRYLGRLLPGMHQRQVQKSQHSHQ